MTPPESRPQPGAGNEPGVEARPAERLSREMHALIEKADGRAVQLGEVLGAFPQRSHAVVLAFLSFPLCLPVGVPVFTASLGLVLASVGASLALGREPWIPRRLRTMAISYERLVRVVERLQRVTQRLERRVHPRLLALTAHGPMMRVHGVFAMLLGLAEAIPIPLPFKHMIPGVPLFLLSLSLLERDGILVMVSYIAAVPCVVFYGGLAFLVLAGLERLILN